MPLRFLLVSVSVLALAPFAAPARAQEKAPPSTWEPALASVDENTGGTSAETAPGGSADARRSGALAYGAPAPRRPIARVFEVAPGKVTTGSPMELRVRIDESGVRAVSARVVALNAANGQVAARFSLGRVRVGRVVTRAWPTNLRDLAPASYVVRLHVKDPKGATLARAASTSGKATLVVTARPRPRPEKPQPEPQPQPDPTPVTSPTEGVFPVAGAHTFGTDDGRFGAGRPGRTHEGQDIAADQGVPIVSPLPGTVAFVDYQKDGAGWYFVINADDGRSFFFAHVKAGSITVKPGQRVAAATTVAQVGSTGASSGPHLHFEIWMGGWRDRGGKPVDPLPQLKAWDN